MINSHKKYLRLIYLFLFIFVGGLTITTLYLHKKSNDLLFRSAIKIIEAKPNEMSQYFPNDTVKLYNSIMDEINKSNNKDAIIPKYFSNPTKCTENMSIFLSAVFRSMYKNRADFALTSLDISDPYNYCKIKLQKYGKADCSFNLVFIKELLLYEY